MTETNIIVVDISAKIILDIKISREKYVNQIYNELYPLYFHCNFDLLYEKRIIEPLEKISDISSEPIIILNIVLNIKSTTLHTLDSYIAINTDGKIIDWITGYWRLDNFNCLKDYLNSNYNCLDIITICNIDYYFAILFENGITIIFSHDTKNIVNKFYNVTKIVSTRNQIGLIINNNKLITYNYLGKISKELDNSNELDNIDYKYIYGHKDFFFIIGYQNITIVKYTEEFNFYGTILINKYNISNIVEIYYTLDIPLIAVIKEDSSLISFLIEIKELSENINIKPLDNINSQLLKIQKILNIDVSFVSLTYDYTVFIWGYNEELKKLYLILKNELIDIEDIVVSETHIGILKKNNSIIIISVFNGIYNIIDEHIYVKIISNNRLIFALADDKVYEIDNLQLICIQELNNIKELYTNIIYLVAVSYDNIVYVYDYSNEFCKNYKSLFYQKQILDFKSIRITDYSLIIIKNNNELIEITGNKDENVIFKNISKFIKIAKY